MSVALNTKHLSSFISEEEYAAIYAKEAVVLEMLRTPPLLSETYT